MNLDDNIPAAGLVDMASPDAPVMARLTVRVLDGSVVMAGFLQLSDQTLVNTTEAAVAHDHHVAGL